MIYDKYIDGNGFPGTLGEDGSFDGGDTAAIMGTVIALDRLDAILPYELMSMALLNKDDLPIRHPDITRWYGQGDRFSRDQLIPLICAAVRLGGGPLEAFYQAHQNRYFLTAWNTKKNGAMEAPSKSPDITGPEVWSLWIRYKRPRWARLVLWFLDLEHLLGAIHWRLLRKDRVTRNHMLVAITIYKYMPTWVSRLAFKINDWHDLITRWSDHCTAVGEYPTADLFKENLHIKSQL